MDRIRREPALAIGIIAAAILAGVQYAASGGIISADLADTVGKALDPAQGGWLLPIALAFVTRLFVSPAEKVGL